MLSVTSPARQRLKQKLQKEIEDADTFLSCRHQNIRIFPAFCSLRFWRLLYDIKTLGQDQSGPACISLQIRRYHSFEGGPVGRIQPTCGRGPTN